MKTNHTQKVTEMFIMLIRKTCPGLYENILNFYKALSSKNEWSFFFLWWIGHFLSLQSQLSWPSAQTWRWISSHSGNSGESHKCIQATVIAQLLSQKTWEPIPLEEIKASSMGFCYGIITQKPEDPPAIRWRIYQFGLPEGWAIHCTAFPRYGGFFH